MTSVSRRFACVIVLLSAVATGTCFAEGVTPLSSPFNVEDSLSDTALDALRGGFVTNAGLQIAFGIERAVYVNGNLVTTTSLNVADSLGVAQAARAIGLIQSGTNNTFNPGAMAASSVSTVIQNSLDNQKIQGVTIVNATVNSLELTKRSDLSSSIQSALTGSLRR